MTTTNHEGYKDMTPYLASRHARAGEVWTVQTQYGLKKALIMQIYESIIRVLYIYPKDRIEDSEYVWDIHRGRIDVRQLTWTAPSELDSYCGKIPKDVMIAIEDKIAHTLEHYQEICQGGDDA